MTDDNHMDPLPIMKAMIGHLEKSVADKLWIIDVTGNKEDPPQWCKDARRTVNEAKQFVAMYEGLSSAK